MHTGNEPARTLTLARPHHSQGIGDLPVAIAFRNEPRAQHAIDLTAADVLRQVVSLGELLSVFNAFRVAAQNPMHECTSGAQTH